MKTIVNSYKRRFAPGLPCHIYRRSLDRGVIFYADLDYLVYFTVSSTASRKYHIQVLSATYMFNHVHEMVGCDTIQSLRGYQESIASSFVRIYNADKGINGALFDPPFGSAPKRNGKDIRSCANYIANNAPEKKLCARSVEYRWSFLAYATCRNPFSEPFVANCSSRKLRMAMRIVRERREREDYLEYPFLRAMKRKLNKKEWEQLVDYIVVQYMYIDFRACARYYGSVENMITAPDSNTGKEFDLVEDSGSGSFVPYNGMCRILDGKGLRSPYGLPDSMLDRLILEFRSCTGGDLYHISRFLHVTEERVWRVIYCDIDT